MVEHVFSPYTGHAQSDAGNGRSRAPSQGQVKAIHAPVQPPRSDFGAGASDHDALGEASKNSLFLPLLPPHLSELVAQGRVVSLCLRYLAYFPRFL